MVAASQADMFPDLPAGDSTCGVFAELREFWRASQELGGLLTQTQAARILDVPTGQLCTWVRRGRLTSREVAGVRMVSALEVLVLRRERDAKDRHVGGRALKAPSLAELAAAARADMDF